MKVEEYQKQYLKDGHSFTLETSVYCRPAPLPPVQSLQCTSKQVLSKHQLSHGAKGVLCMPRLCNFVEALPRVKLSPTVASKQYQSHQQHRRALTIFIQKQVNYCYLAAIIQPVIRPSV